VVGAVVLVVILLGACAWAISSGPPTHTPAPPAPPTPITPSTAPAADPAGPGALADPDAPAARILRDWDAARARAYAEASPSDLRALYVPRSAVGRADRRVLRAYAGRGLTVRDARMEVAEVVEVGRTGMRLRVAVVERLGPAYAVAGDGRRLPLPRDNWRERRLVLAYADGRWRMAAATPRAPRG